MSAASLAENFARHFQEAIDAAKLPDGFYDSFRYTSTGTNLCHPITLSMIGNAVGKLDGVSHVGIDVRLNLRKGVKFQPDVVGFRRELSGHVIYVDFESPNSSDARIDRKDICRYLDWSACHEAAPYIVITSLPDKSVDGWELRWKSKGRTNEKHQGKLSEIAENPLRYWLKVWSRDSAVRDLSRVTFLNIDGKAVRRLEIPQRGPEMAR